MWYGVLPSLTIITTALYVPNMYAYFSNKFVIGQPYRRVVTTNQTSHLFLRDARLSGRMDAYDYKGLDNIPDLKTPKM